MRRLILLPVVLVAVVAALLVSSCSVKDPPALTVGSWSLSRDDFLNTLNQLNKSQGASNQAVKFGTDGTTPVSYQAAYTAQVLDLYAQWQLVTQTLAQRGGSITDADTQAAYQFLASQLSQQSQQGQQVTAEQAKAQLDQFGPAKQQVVEQYAGLVALARGAQSNDELLRAEYEKSKQLYSCVSAIVVVPDSARAAAGAQSSTTTAPPDPEALRAKADDLKSQLDSGADFAALAKANSADRSASQGGALGCGPRGALQQKDLDDAVWSLSDGGVSRPLELASPTGGSGGYVIFKVTRRYTPTLDELKPDLEPKVLQDQVQRVQAELVAKEYKSIPVTVDPLFGEWNAERSRVQPPAGAEVPSTTTSLPSGLSLGGLPSVGGAPAG